MANSANIVPDKWLAEILQQKVYKLTIDDMFITNARNTKSGEYSQMRNVLQTKPVFIYAKVSPTAVEHIAFLEKKDFHLVDTNIVFDKPIEAFRTLSGNCIVRLAIPDDEMQTVEVARKAFQYSRFHLDNVFPKDVSDTIKAEWVRNYFRGQRGETMVIAIINNTVVGFLQLLQSTDDILIIDLIGVDRSHRRKEIARDMISYAETHYQNYKKLVVGTQIANIPSIRLYESLGFKVSYANYVFHYHNI